MTVSGLLTLSLPFYTTYGMLVAYSVLLGLAVCKFIASWLDSIHLQGLIVLVCYSLHVGDETLDSNQIGRFGKCNQCLWFHASLLRTVWNLWCPSGWYVPFNSIQFSKMITKTLKKIVRWENECNNRINTREIHMHSRRQYFPGYVASWVDMCLCWATTLNLWINCRITLRRDW